MTREGIQVRDSPHPGPARLSYVAKVGVVYREVLAPAGAPAWARERGTLWNMVEACERRQDAQVAREVRVALPAELSVDAQMRLVRCFAGEQFTRRGMVADVAIHHDNPANPHCAHRPDATAA